MVEAVDILIIGGGISGVSLAARLAGHRSVVLVEAEEHLGTQTTARSAATLVEAYGPPGIRPLTKASRRFFETPPDGFTDVPLCSGRPVLVYGAADQLDRLHHEYGLARQATGIEWLDAEGVLETCPLLRPGIAAAGFLEPGALALDVNALLQGFAGVARRNGARLLTGAPVRRIAQTPDGWRVEAGARGIACGLLVNAAGAWADRVAGLAGVAPIGLEPRRRTAATIAVPESMAALLPRHPLVAPLDESFYFKPEVGSIMVSLSEETPSEPMDPWPDDIDVATALERFHAATIVPETRPTAAWAGLRTFASDRLPVVGFDAAAQSFFWYAGQGGYGIQTAPALSALGAKLLLGQPLDQTENEIALSLDAGRFQATAA
jgi:D-arginine dehydrogenase